MFFFLPVLQSQVSQIPCGPYEFEIVKNEPNVNHYPSNVAGPSAFHTYYTVRLKKTSGVFTENWEVSHLAFGGRIKSNNFTSSIDRELTISLHTGTGGAFSNPFFQYLDLAAIGNGEVVWKVGEDEECEEMDPANTISLPLKLGSSSMDLFTIAVKGVPGDFVTFLDLGGTVCVPGCTGGMPVNYLQTLDVIFPTPALFSPPVGVSFSKIQVGNEPHILVTLNGLTPGGSVRKIDGVVHIEPDMNTTPDLDLAAISINSFFNIEKRENADGSFDFYFYTNWPLSGAFLNASEDIFSIMIDGIYNLSQGGDLHCSLTSGREAVPDPPLGVTTTTCSLRGSNTTIIITGYPPCSNDFTVSATQHVAPNCELGATYTLTFQGGSTLNLDNLHLRFGFFTDDNTNPPLLVNAPQLPCPSCWTINTVAPGRYTCEYINNSPLTLVNGATITIPFTVNQDCVEFFVLMAEGAITNGSGTCALDAQIDLNNWPACDPSVHGRIIIGDDITGLTVPDYMVTLSGQPNYLLQDFDNCDEEYTFCPDQSKAPFQLTINTAPAAVNNYRCGDCATAFDMLLINRQILGIQPLAVPYRLIAADVDRSYTVSTFDIVTIRKCILGTQTNFANPFSPNPNGAPSWYYINDSYQFNSNPNDILEDQFWEAANTIQVPANGQGDYGLFHAVKMGDVNLNCNCSGHAPLISNNLSDRVDFAGFRINASTIRQEGNLLRIPVYAKSHFDIAAMQGGFRFDAAALTLDRIIPNMELGISESAFGTLLADQGEIRFAWFAEDGATLLPEGALLFTLEFKLKSGATRPSGQFCWLSDNILKNRIYSLEDREISAQLVWEDSEQEITDIAVIINPNPFRTTAKVFIFSDKAQTGTLHLQDNRGLIQMQQVLELQKGDNAFDIQTDVPPGLYFISVAAGGKSVQQKVLKL